ncbi:MAG: hypothetical protein Q8K92_22665 [Leadbetterella sp.]|nr:hypothetical protein [Leadbetterella sp.]
MIQVKEVDSSIEKFLKLSKSKNYKLSASGHHLDNLPISIKKGVNQFEYEVVSPIVKGLQQDKELQFSPDAIIGLCKGQSTIYTFGHAFVSNYVTYGADFASKISRGLITKISSVQDDQEMNDHYLRMILPVDTARPFDINQFQRKFFKTKTKREIYFIEVVIAGDTYELFIYKHEKKHYVVIDCKSRTTLKIFQRKAYNLLLALAVIRGDLIGNESLVLSYKTAKHAKIQNFLYHSNRENLITNQPVFTSNPMAFYYNYDFEREKNFDLTKREKEKLYDDIIDFEAKVFSNLATLIHENEKIQRAAFLLLIGNTATLEVRLPNYYLAIEAIAEHISGPNTDKKLIKDKKIASEIKKYIIDYLQDLKDKRGLDDEELNLKILQNKINSIESPPNSSKLSEPFLTLGFKLLSKKELKDLLGERNTYLHGNFFISSDDEKVFQEAFYIGTRLHLMVSFLLLKLSGFNGKIVNYAEVWSHITKREVKEDRLVKI